MTELQYPVPTLTDKQRAKVVEFYDSHPDGGYKNALAHAGIHVTKAVAKQAILDDPELADVPMRALRVDEDTAFKAIGDILSNPDHKDRLRAATFALGLHGYREKSEVMVSGEVEVGSGDLAAALERFTATVTRLTDRAQSGGAVRGLAAAAAELPAGEARR